MKRKSTPSPAYAYKAARHWSMRAEEMRTLAEEARDPMVRAMMLGIAADYDSCAEIAHDCDGAGSIMFRLAEVRPESRPDVPSSGCAVKRQAGFAPIKKWSEALDGS
jgi:hypothetical protein